MQRKAIKTVSYTRSYKDMIVKQIVYGRESIAKVCALEGIAGRSLPDSKSTLAVTSWSPVNLTPYAYNVAFGDIGRGMASF